MRRVKKILSGQRRKAIGKWLQSQNKEKIVKRFRLVGLSTKNRKFNKFNSSLACIHQGVLKAYSLLGNSNLVKKSL